MAQIEVIAVEIGDVEIIRENLLRVSFLVREPESGATVVSEFALIIPIEELLSCRLRVNEVLSRHAILEINRGTESVIPPAA